MAPRSGMRSEMDPLLIKEASTLSSSSAAKSSKKSVNPRTIISSVVGVLTCCLVVGIVVRRYTTSSASATANGPANQYGYAEVTDNGQFVVHYSEEITAVDVQNDPSPPNDGPSDYIYDDDDENNNNYAISVLTNHNNNNSTPASAATPSQVNRTFGELAKIMLPPWHYASILAVQHSIDEHVKPSNRTLKNARQVLKIGRDLLDVFSPVYGPKSIWKKLRRLYADGYEKVGYYKDLSASKMVYDEKLWTERLHDILVWKKKFLRFDKKYDIVGFLVSLEGNNCYVHKQSHLFWGDLDGVQLPCTNDDATASLDHLMKVQLLNSLNYYDIVIHYDTVLTVEEQEDYHNLRKELRDVVDEFNLFGNFLLLPGDTADKDLVADQCIKTFATAVHKIGVFHDEWVAYDKYNSDKSHLTKQAELADSINKQWIDFKKWMLKVDLRGTIRSLLDELE